MERINELLAKGIENLTAEELSELQTLAHEEADARLDDGDDSDEAIAELETIAGLLDQVRAEETRRAEIAAEKAAKKAELADRIRNGGNDEGDGDGGDGEDAEGTSVEVEVEVSDEDAETAEPELVDATASTATPAVTASPAPVISRVAARRPAAVQPRRTQVRQAALLAAASVPGIQPGRRLDDRDAIHEAFSGAAELVASSERAIKIPVGTLRASIPDELMLSRDPVANEDKIKARTSVAAITASGGICAPVPYRYDLPTVGDDVRPVRDALATFGAQRGGIRTITPPTIADVTGAVGQWTAANDESPSSPATKPYLTIACDDDETITKVYAVTQGFKIGNFRDRWFPEQVRAYMDLVNVFTARYAEAKMLAAIASGSKVVNHGQLLGSAQDIFTSLRQLFMGIRYRHRIARGQTFRVIGFEWVRDNIIADLIRKGPGDATLEERLVMAETAVDAFFRQLNVNVAWSPDYQFGVALGSPGGPPAGTQGAGTAIGYPSVARFYVHLEGSWLHLDGGSLDLGVYRDSALIATNDMMMFAEYMENVHYHGLPGESYVYDIDICANGGIASALDIAPCVTGS